MAAVVEVNSTLASKCMDFCQALISQGQVFNFSLSVGPTFSFSLDTTRSKAPRTKKKPSPSTLRRNARRREEFKAKKQQSSPTSTGALLPSPEKEKRPLCALCDFEAASEQGLKTHKRMKHKEILRSSHEGSTDVSISPLLDVSREEPTPPRPPPPSFSEESFTPSTSTCEDCKKEIGENWHHGVDCDGCCERWTKQLCEDCCIELSRAE
jgi:hypothetical protein